MIGQVSKACFKCGEVKLLSEFYKHPGMADGHLNKCKDCTKKDVKEHREDNLEKIQEYDRERNRNMTEKRRAGRWKPTAELRALYIARSNERFPERRKANIALSNAVRDNRVQRPSYCESCGKECIPHGHHPSYAEDMWLHVTWLCSSCHGEIHRKYP